MNKTWALINTLLAIIVIASCWSLYCSANNVNEGLNIFVSFFIGWFGSSKIYNWLIKEAVAGDSSE